jgi:hypothetical protein
VSITALYETRWCGVGNRREERIRAHGQYYMVVNELKRRVGVSITALYEIRWDRIGNRREKRDHSSRPV